MKTIFLFLGIFLSLQLSAQVDSTKTDDDIYGNAEVAPEFPGGTDALYKYISTNQQYPANAKNEGIQGKVYVEFVIDQLGFVQDVKVLRGIIKEMDEEAIRLVKNMPRWKPGTMNGKPIKVKYTIPIVFKLH